MVCLIGNLQIKTNEQFLTVELKNFDDTTFAVANVPENFETSVEKCVDSSRGYALKLTHEDGRFVWVGLVFHDRNSAFDFFACFEEQLKRKRAAQNVQEFKLDPSLDFTHKKGAKIKINLKKEDEDKLKDNEFYGRPTQTQQGQTTPVQQQLNKGGFANFPKPGGQVSNPWSIPGPNQNKSQQPQQPQETFQQPPAQPPKQVSPPQMDEDFLSY